jgi:hopanoid biosynthesis associated protein HpnK
MLKLVVHADDFGLSEPINDGILKAHRNGVLTSASLMANGRGFEHAVSICRQVPTLDVGVHLTLVEERPVLDAPSVTTLVDENGRFHRRATVLAQRYFRRKISIEQVHSELDAQIRKVLSHGIRVTHLDGHQHAHMLPRILRVTVDLARRYGIRFLRFPAEQVALYMLAKREAFTRLPQLAGLNFLSFLGRNASIRRTDHFVGFFLGGKLNKANLLRVIQHLPRRGTCELMCHPGIDDPQPTHAHWGYRWAEELDALLDREVAEALRRRPVQLTSYRELLDS